MAQNQRPPPRHDRGDDLEKERLDRRLDAKSNDGDAQSQGAPATAIDPADAPAISPIACAFGQEILLGSIKDLSDLAASHGRSAAEAAWRGDVETLGVHLRQASNAIKAATMTFEAIEGEKGNAVGAKVAPA